MQLSAINASLWGTSSIIVTSVNPVKLGAPTAQVPSTAVIALSVNNF